LGMPVIYAAMMIAAVVVALACAVPLTGAEVYRLVLSVVVLVAAGRYWQTQRRRWQTVVVLALCVLTGYVAVWTFQPAGPRNRTAPANLDAGARQELLNREFHRRHLLWLQQHGQR